MSSEGIGVFPVCMQVFKTRAPLSLLKQCYQLCSFQNVFFFFFPLSNVLFWSILQRSALSQCIMQNHLDRAESLEHRNKDSLFFFCQVVSHIVCLLCSVEQNHKNVLYIRISSYREYQIVKQVWIPLLPLMKVDFWCDGIQLVKSESFSSLTFSYLPVFSSHRHQTTSCHPASELSDTLLLPFFKQKPVKIKAN